MIDNYNSGYTEWMGYIKCGECLKVCWAHMIEDKWEKASIWSSNCTNGVVQSRGVGYEKCWDKESECSWDKVFEKFGGSITNG